nr:hypothetical protein Itr_chr03CG07790 [Ipomoea trifida]
MAEGSEQPNLEQQMTTMMRMLEQMRQDVDNLMARPQNQPIELSNAPRNTEAAGWVNQQVEERALQGQKMVFECDVVIVKL